MSVLWIPIASAVLLVCAVLAVRLMRSTGLETVAEGFATAEDGGKQRKGFAELLDGLGARFMGTALRIYGPKRLRKLDQTIRRAGQPDGVTVNAYVRRQTGFVVLAIVFFVVTLILGQPIFGGFIAIVLMGWMRLWLHSTASKRQQEIERELPDFLDVLGVTVAAGLSFRQAVERISDHHDGPMGEEMRTVLDEMQVGVPRREALLGLRDRNQSEALASVVTALLQAEELGVPLQDALQDISQDARREHAQAMKVAAAKAAPKISVVVTTTILPAALLLVGSALLMANADVLKGVF
ncbi:MAG TPA: type II secretion system F family protein [Actinomycetales bacterium]|nr:type II secretion system F family protein [Actinomycetales bacterium]